MIVFALIAAAASSAESNVLQEHAECMKTSVVRLEKSKEAAETVADAALASCESIWLNYKNESLSNRPANASLSYSELKKFLDDFWSDVAKSARSDAVKTIVEIRAKRASH